MADTNKPERRSISMRELRVRRDEGKPPVITGYAAVFNSLSQDLGGFQERIKPGAFRKSLAENDVRALVDHESAKVLGRNKAKTLRMVEDDNGLSIEIDPPDTSYANDLLISMERGDIDQMSFGFCTRTDNWKKENGVMVREYPFACPPHRRSALPPVQVLASARHLRAWRLFRGATLYPCRPTQPRF